jgi:hypothetical protein
MKKINFKKLNLKSNFKILLMHKSSLENNISKINQA